MATPRPHGDDVDVLVVGGGVVGLACAWTLAKSGMKVTVLDPGQPDARATWAAGGMLAPLGEAPEPGPFLALGVRSLSLFPGFAAELEEVSGHRVGLHLNGKLLTASTGDDIRRLEGRRNWLRADGHPARWLDGAEVRALEPSVAEHVQAGLLLEGNGRVDNRALQEALTLAAERAGVARIEGRARGVVHRGGAVESVELQTGSRIPASRILLAAGAWSGTLSGLPRPLPTRPVKGQMLAFGTPHRPLGRVVTSPEAYLIPRETPTGPVVVVGATSEDGRFDLSVEEAGQRALWDGAVRLVPGLEGAPVVERWAGLRPGTPDDLPILGPDPELDGLFFATGHYRNGVLLAPATAVALRDWMTGGRPAGMDAFAPERFHG